MNNPRRIGIALGLLLGLGASAGQGQPPGHGFHPAMPDQEFHLQCRLEPVSGAPVAVETPLPLPSLLAPADLDLPITLPGPGPAVRVKRYLPRATLEQNVVADESAAGRPAIELAIEGPTQSYRRWLLADDPERNRLISFIGTWRFMPVADARERDALFQQFKDELTREPLLRIAGGKGDPTHSLPARPGESRTVQLGNAQPADSQPAEAQPAEVSIKVIHFYPHYGMEGPARKPVNLSERRVNPAALVEIERGSRKEERWVFAKFPDFKTSASQIPLIVTLECPLETQGETPDFVLVTIARSSHEVWKRHQGKTSVQPLKLDEKVEVGGSPYTFKLARFVPAGRLNEQYVAAEDKGTVSALHVEVRDSTGPAQTLWLESGKQRTLPVTSGLLLLAFGPRSKAGSPNAPAHPAPPENRR